MTNGSIVYGEFPWIIFSSYSSFPRASIQLYVLTQRIRYESSWAWLSTLGGGHSCLGEESARHVGTNRKIRIQI